MRAATNGQISVRVEFDYSSDRLDARNLVYQGAMCQTEDELVMAIKENLGKSWSRGIEGVDLSKHGAMAIIGQEWGFTRYHPVMTGFHPTAFDANNRPPQFARDPFLSVLTVNSSLSKMPFNVYGMQIGKTWIAALVCSLVTAQNLKHHFPTYSEVNNVEQNADVILPFPFDQRGVNAFPAKTTAKAKIHFNTTNAYIVMTTVMNAGTLRENLCVMNFENEMRPGGKQYLAPFLDPNTTFNNGYHMLAALAETLTTNIPEIRSSSMPDKTPKTPMVEVDVADTNEKVALPPDLPLLPKQGQKWVPSTTGLIYVRGDDGRLMAPYEVFNLNDMAEGSAQKKAVSALFDKQYKLLQGMMFNYEVLGGFGE